MPFILLCLDVVVDPVSNIWFDPDTEFVPDKPVACKADGYPRPSFHWIRTSDNSTVATDAKLVAKFTNDSYTCIATNTVNGQQHTAMSVLVSSAGATGIRLELSY